MISIAYADFDDPRLVTFLEDHLRDMEPTAPASSRHALDLDGLRKPGVRLWAAHSGEEIVGTVALAELSPGHDELKTMRTSPIHRGQGIASQLLNWAIKDAYSRGVERISLETGTMSFFTAARELYRKAGFSECVPFGNYRKDSNSVFMTKAILVE